MTNGIEMIILITFAVIAPIISFWVAKDETQDRVGTFIMLTCIIWLMGSMTLILILDGI